jgi:hypothetical protein
MMKLISAELRYHFLLLMYLLTLFAVILSSYALIAAFFDAVTPNDLGLGINVFSMIIFPTLMNKIYTENRDQIIGLLPLKRSQVIGARIAIIGLVCAALTIIVMVYHMVVYPDTPTGLLIDRFLILLGWMILAGGAWLFIWELNYSEARNWLKIGLSVIVFAAIIFNLIIMSYHMDADRLTEVAQPEMRIRESPLDWASSTWAFTELFLTGIVVTSLAVFVYYNRANHTGRSSSLFVRN